MTIGSPIGLTACEGVLIGSQPWKRIHCDGCADAAALREQLRDLERAKESATLAGAASRAERDRLYEQAADDLVQHGDLCGQIETLRAELDGARAAHQAAFDLGRVIDADRDDLRTRLATAEALALTNGEARGRAEAEVARLKDLLDRDRSGLAEGLGKVRKRAIGGRWISQGRGSYAWDDDAYRKETGIMVADIIAIADEHLRDSGRLADEAFHPKLSESLAAAEAERDELRGLLTSARAVIVHSSFAVGASAARAWLAAHPAAIPEGTSTARK